MIALLLAALLVSGAVQTPDGLPIPAAAVVVLDASARTATSAADGKFSIDIASLPADIEVRERA